MSILTADKKKVTFEVDKTIADNFDANTTRYHGSKRAYIELALEAFNQACLDHSMPEMVSSMVLMGRIKVKVEVD